MYTAINLQDKTSITTRCKTILSSFIGINPSTLWRQLSNKDYLEYKHFIIVVNEVTKRQRTGSYKHLRAYSDRIKEINKLLSDENMQ